MNYNELKNTVFHTAIIGAGAGGLFCAGSFNSPKVLIEHNTHPGKKISISGGGKCNFSNRFAKSTDYDCANKHFVKNALAAFKPQDFVSLLNEAGLKWEERKDGQLFAMDARDIVRFLIRRAREANTQILTDTQALDVRQENGLFTVNTSAGPVRAQRVILATGGLSFPALGASNFGIKIARQFGLNIIPQRPALVGLTFDKALREQFFKLAGNTLNAHIMCGKHNFEGSLLFTHEGISGPAVLSASLFWKEGEKVTVDFLPGEDAHALFSAQKNSAHTFAAALHGKISTKIVKALLGELDDKLPNASRADIEKAAQSINRFVCLPAGTGGFSKAEVTAGGIDVREINPSTFGVRRVPGLYAIGELLDVTGRLGGFNLQWAWSSGFSAAKALEKMF